MTTLMIKDLSLTEELDRKAMAAVHGGVIKTEGDGAYHKQPNPYAPWDTDQGAATMANAWWTTP